MNDTEKASYIRAALNRSVLVLKSEGDGVGAAAIEKLLSTQTTSMLRIIFDQFNDVQNGISWPKPEAPITPSQLADALECFHNAAIGHAHRESVTSLAMDVATTLAEGFNAIGLRLREISEK